MIADIDELPFSWTYGRDEFKGVEYWEPVNHALGGYRMVERRLMTGAYILHDMNGELGSLPASFTPDEACKIAVARKRV